MHNNEFLQLLILELHVRPICGILQYFSICNSMGRSEIWDKFNELNDNFAVIATMNGITKISLPLVLSQIKNIACFVKVKIFFCKLAFTMSSGFLLLL